MLNPESSALAGKNEKVGPEGKQATRSPKHHALPNTPSSQGAHCATSLPQHGDWLTPNLLLAKNRKAKQENTGTNEVPRARILEAIGRVFPTNCSNTSHCNYRVITRKG